MRGLSRILVSLALAAAARSRLRHSGSTPFKLYLPRHPLPPETGLVFGGILPSVLIGLVAALVAVSVFLSKTSTSHG